MPLLNKQPLELHRYNKRLKDDAEVFYCKSTNEIFEDYEEYCQRVICCNSLIWTCAITGKTNLTYQEALASEENAMKSIKDFPPELRTPILYIASITNRRNFNDLVNDVFNFVKDRYFLGEFVEVCFDGVWVFGHVLRVMLPSKEEVEEYCETNKVTEPLDERYYPGVLYKYEVEQLYDKGEDITEVRVLPGDKVRRVKNVYTKDKNRIYLKQFAELNKDRWCIQSNILAKYSISSILYSNLFVGEPPVFEDPPTPDPVYIQQTLDMYLTKKPDKGKQKTFEVPKKMVIQKKVVDVKEIHKKYQDTINRVVEQARNDSGKDWVKPEVVDEKAKKLEELRKKREAEREEKARWATFVKEWHRKREDLECEDLKELPEPCPVDCRVPNEHFGDIVMILEFFSSFRDVLKVRDYFPYGLKFDIVERALAEVEIAGPFSDILQLLLTALFSLQEQEDDEIQSTSLTDLEIDETGDISTAQAIKLATIAASWSNIYHGVPINQLSLDAITVSEVLRLHLLSSGGRAGDRSAKWRYQERGGYTSTDDPCLMLRLKEPHILRFLAVKSVAELPLADKVKVLSCLINQIITYAELRDIIDDRYDKVRTTRYELRNDQQAEAKKEREMLAQKAKEKKEAKEKGEVVPEETEEQKTRETRESVKKKSEFQKRQAELFKAAMECHIAPLGQDRGYRRFWIFSTMGGLFVEDYEEWPGSCLPHPTPTARDIANIEEDTMSYVKRLFEEERNCGSDKENEGNSSLPVASPKKKFLSESNDLTNAPNAISMPPVKKEEDEVVDEERKSSRLVCTGNQETCWVHSRDRNRTRWLFYYKETDFDELINSLNKRGVREHRLRKTLLDLRDNIVPKLGHCPVNQLNRFHQEVVPVAGNVKHTRSQRGYENANLKYPPGTPIQEILELYIRELILDTEEKIHCGGLGTLKVKNRDAWRTALESRSYDRQDDNLTWKQRPVKKNSEKKEEDTSRPDTPCSMDSDHEVLPEKTGQNQVVKDLASAVLQIERAVEQKYFHRPPGKKDKPVDMDKWETSLMSSTSFAQVYLHIATLERRIQWNKSTLNAKCKVCRRGGDAENMLLCDNCNGGFHLYCLKPPLTSIPEGDWFCLGCRPKEKVEKRKRSRRIFSDESDDEDDLPLAVAQRKSKMEEGQKNKRRKREEQEEEKKEMEEDEEEEEEEEVEEEKEEEDDEEEDEEELEEEEIEEREEEEEEQQQDEEDVEENEDDEDYEDEEEEEEVAEQHENYDDSDSNDSDNDSDSSDEPLSKLVKISQKPAQKQS